MEWVCLVEHDKRPDGFFEVLNRVRETNRFMLQFQL